MLLQIINGKRGSTIVGVLAAVVFIGIVTTLMVSITQSQSQATSGFTAAKTANVTSSAALRIAESFLTTEQGFNTLLNFTGEEVIENGNLGNNQRYEIRLLDFNPVTFFAKIEARGRGRGAGMRRTVGVYLIDNIERQRLDNQFQDALHVRSDNFETNSPMGINGNTYFGGSGNFNVDASTINGNFVWVDDNPGTDGLRQLNQGITVLGNAYFDVPNLDLNNNPINVFGNIGFERPFGNLNSDIDVIGGNAYFRGTDNGFITTANHVPGNINMNGGEVFTPNNAPFHEQGIGDVINGFETVRNDLPEDLRALLLPPPLVAPTLGDLTEIEDIAQNTSGLPGNWNGDHLQGLFDDNTIPRTPEGYIVVRVDQAKRGWWDGGGTFDGRLILLVDEDLDFGGGGMFQSGPNANTLMIVRNGANVSNMARNDGLNFRGLIYTNNGTIDYIGSAQSETNIEGAIYCMQVTDRFRTQGGSNVNINFNPDILQDISNLGIFGNLDDQTDDNRIEIIDNEMGGAIPILISEYQY
ncbi:hypothetical protein CHISP_2322 [Chitinispirillum alkaliphilum]|nr:hypothetical protein CHISP_2322 [Chitinispirillum alkaliphilum]